MAETNSPQRRCDHVDSSGRMDVCIHLWDAHKGSSSDLRRYYRRFLGQGLDRTLECSACGEGGHSATSPKISLCAECFAEVEDSECLGNFGVPGSPIRDAGLSLETAFLPPLAGFSAILKVVAITAEQGACWLAFTEKRELLRIDFSKGTMLLICHLKDMELPADKKVSLVVSKYGDYAAVVFTHGQFGIVVELASGEVKMNLDRGDYRNENGVFSVAFFEYEGRSLLVHATRWNRLDISDPMSGRLLTSRELEPLVQRGPLPKHYLDYFHCGLSASPGGEWIADNGWVWHPYGVVRTWSLRRWIESNVWESEDGETLRSDVSRAYYWDGPMCWVGAHELAVWGVGCDDYSLLPAVQIIDVRNGNANPILVGPFGPARSAGSAEVAAESRKFAIEGTMEFDGFLMVWSPAAGFTAWELTSGARVFADETFCPIAYNRATKEFLSQSSDGRYVLSKLVSG